MQERTPHPVTGMMLHNGKILRLQSTNSSMRPSLCPLPSENIKVAVRVRPQLPGEENETQSIEVDEARGSIFYERGARKDGRGRQMADDGTSERFNFDSVWGKTASQSDVFVEVEPLVDSAFQGYNTTVFCHGPSGSGKTHTMVGTDQQPGIVPKALSRIFQLAGQQENRMLVVVLSVLELYNDQFYDMLDTSLTSKEAAARKATRQSAGGFGAQGIFSPPRAAKIEVVRQGKQSMIKGAYTRLQVDGAEEAMAEIERAMMKRSTAGTGMNDRSSRSHAIIMVQVQQADRTTSGSSSSSGSKKDKEEGSSNHDDSLLTPPSRRRAAVAANGAFTTTVGTLYLVDLAGSERLKLSGVSGEGQKEAQHINKSLSALGNVLTALSKPHREGTVIPYRDSKLTLLLQDALGGNSRTMMITCISALASVGQHTSIALQYAQRAKLIQNCASKQLDTDKTSEIEGLKREVEELKQRLAERHANALASESSADAGGSGVVDAGSLQRQYEQLRAVLEENDKEKKELQGKLEKVINGRFMSDEDDWTLLQAELESSIARLAMAYQENEVFKRKICELERRVETDEGELESTRRRSMALQKESRSLSERNEALERRVRELEEREAAAVQALAAKSRQEEEVAAAASKDKMSDGDSEPSSSSSSSSSGVNCDAAQRGDCEEEVVVVVESELNGSATLSTVDEEEDGVHISKPGGESASPSRGQGDVLKETLTLGVGGDAGERGAETTVTSPVSGGSPIIQHKAAGEGTPKAAFLKSPRMLHLSSPMGSPMLGTEQNPQSPGEILVTCLDTGEKMPVKTVLNGVSSVLAHSGCGDACGGLGKGRKRPADAGSPPPVSSKVHKAMKAAEGQTDRAQRGDAPSAGDRRALSSIANTLKNKVKSLNPFQ